MTDPTYQTFLNPSGPAQQRPPAVIDFANSLLPGLPRRCPQFGYRSAAAAASAVKSHIEEKLGGLVVTRSIASDTWLCLVCKEDEPTIRAQREQMKANQARRHAVKE